MTTITKKIILEFFRNEKSIGSVEPDTKNSSYNFNFSTTSSIDKFPTAAFQGQEHNFNNLFRTFSQSDIVQMSVQDGSSDNTPNIFFKGEFQGKTIEKQKGDSELLIKIKAIHSFYKLSLIKLTKPPAFVNVEFGTLVSDLCRLASVTSPITISDELAKSKINGVCREVNAFRIFKELCTLKDAVAVFNSNNTVNIELRKDLISRIRGKSPIEIHEDDIISMEKSERI